MKVQRKTHPHVFEDLAHELSRWELAFGFTVDDEDYIRFVNEAVSKHSHMDVAEIQSWAIMNARSHHTVVERKCSPSERAVRILVVIAIVVLAALTVTVLVKKANAETLELESLPFTITAERLELFAVMQEVVLLNGQAVNLSQIGGTTVSGSMYDAANTALKVNCVTGCAAGGGSSNITQFGGVNLSTGTGVGGTGIPRVTVSSDSFPASQAVTGTFFQGTQPVSIAAMPSTPVTGTFFQTTQPVSGTVAVNGSVKVVNTPFQPLSVSVMSPMYVAILSNGQIVPVQLFEGQALMSQSLPVTLASNQSAIPVTISGTQPISGVGADGQAHTVATDGAGNQVVVPLGLPRAPCNAVRTTNCQHF